MNKKKEIIMGQTYEFSFCYNLLHYWYLISIVFREIKDPQTKISEKFNSHIENSNHKKKMNKI